MAWMVRNRVTPNLLMIVLLVGGFIMSFQIKKEVFPNFQMDEVRVAMAYPGASPEEVEQGIVLALEEAISGVGGVEEINVRANEGSALVTAKVLEGENAQTVYQEIQQ